MELGAWQTVRRQHRIRNNNEIDGPLLPGNGSLIGVERNLDLYLGECAIGTSESGVFTNIRAQCIYRLNVRHLKVILVISNRLRYTPNH